MSIFNGHENKSLEELADELGILDSSVVDKTEETLLKTLNKPERTLETDIHKNQIWTGEFRFQDLKKGMSVRCNGIIGKIKELRFEKLGKTDWNIKIDRNSNVTEHSKTEFMNLHLVNKEDLSAEDEIKWTSDFKISDLKELMNIKDGINEGHIDYIDFDEKLIEVVRDNDTTAKYDFIDFENNVEIQLIECFSNEPERTNNFEFNNLKDNDEVMNPSNDNTGVISWREIRRKGNVIGIKWKDSISIEYNFEKIKKTILLNITKKIKKLEELKAGTIVIEKESRYRYIVDKFYIINGIDYIIIKNGKIGDTRTIDRKTFKSKWKALRNL